MLKRDDTCGFSGTSDLYGLGIRLGIYFQWLTCLIVFLFFEIKLARQRQSDRKNEDSEQPTNDLQRPDYDPVERLRSMKRSIQEAYFVFFVAVTLAIIVITARSGTIYDVEVIILMYIIFGGMFIISAATKEDFATALEARLNVAIGWDDAIQFICFLAIGSYCAWFWIRGIETRFTPTPCGSFTLFFAKVSLYNKSVRAFFAFLGIAFTIVFFLSFLSFLARIWARKTSRDEAEVACPLTPGYTEWVKSRRSSGTGFYDYIFAPAICIMFFIYSVLGIELTIYWNSIKDVYTIDSTGQLIPFVIGVVGIATVASRCFEYWRKSGVRKGNTEGGSAQTQVLDTVENTKSD